jgi:hypothetical protein
MAHAAPGGAVCPAMNRRPAFRLPATQQAASFGHAADLAVITTLGLRVVLERLQASMKLGRDRIPTDADDGGLAEREVRQLVDGPRRSACPSARSRRPIRGGGCGPA